MKKISLQWRITLMTAILIGITCVSMNSLIGYSGRHYMDSIGSGKTVFVETCCADFGSRFERAVLQTVLQMDLPTRCILCTVQQGFAA